MFYVAGEAFETRAEYELALKDLDIIDSLKNKYDINSEDGIRKIYVELQGVSFKTAVGDKFDDEIFDLYSQVKNGTLKQNQIKTSKGSNNKKSSRGATKKNSKDSLASMDQKTKALVIKEIKRQNRVRSLFVTGLMIVAVLCLGYFGIYYKNSYNVSNVSREWSELKEIEAPQLQNVDQVLKKDYDEEVVIPEILDEYKILYNKNKSLIGWIKIDDTIIDYPVMQTVDNEYYLKYNFNQKKDANGAIFLDTNCDIILGNTNWILYGHHMNNGKMFSSLIKYANEDYYKKHKYILFDTIYEKGKYEVMYAFRSRVYASDEVRFKYYQFIDAYSAEEFDSYMEEMDKLSLIDTGITAEFGDRLLTLSTCDYQEKNGRFVVVAKRID